MEKKLQSLRIYVTVTKILKNDCITGFPEGKEKKKQG